MRVQTRGICGVVAVLTIAGFVVAGCGGDDDTTTEPATETGAAAAGGAGSGAQGATLEIEMGDFYFDPKNATAKAGQTTIEAPNVGKVEHELVLLTSNLDPAKLPTKANGEIDEDKLKQMGAEEVGEIEAEPGESKSGKFNLTPGKNVMFCNLPGHYAQGMYGSLTVTE